MVIKQFHDQNYPGWKLVKAVLILPYKVGKLYQHLLLETSFYNGENVWSFTKSNIPILNLFYGVTITSISGNHVHVCKCSIHFSISAKEIFTKTHIPHEINYFTQSNMDIWISRYMSPPFFLLLPLLSWCCYVVVGRFGKFYLSNNQRWWEHVLAQLKFRERHVLLRLP